MKIKIDINVLSLEKLNFQDSVLHIILTLLKRMKARKWKQRYCSVIQL
jgi:hypothetical protein